MFRPSLRGPQHNAEPAEDQNLRRALNGWGFRGSLAGGRHRIRLVWITSAAFCATRSRLSAAITPHKSLAFIGSDSARDGEVSPVVDAEALSITRLEGSR